MLLLFTLPLEDEASIISPPPAAIPTCPETTTISPACISENELILVYLPGFLHPEDVIYDCPTPICLRTQYTNPEQSNEFDPFAPHTYGLPIFDEAMLIILPTLPEYEPPPPELPPLDFLSDFPTFEESFLEGPFVFPELNLANVCAPALPSAESPLLLWNLFHADSVSSPKYPVAFDSFKYPAFARRL